MTVYQVRQDTWIEDSEVLKTFINRADAQAYVKLIGDIKGKLCIVPFEVSQGLEEDIVIKVVVELSNHMCSAYVEELNFVEDVIKVAQPDKGKYDLSDVFDGFEPEETYSFGPASGVDGDDGELEYFYGSVYVSMDMEYWIDSDPNQKRKIIFAAVEELISHFELPVEEFNLDTDF